MRVCVRGGEEEVHLLSSACLITAFTKRLLHAWYCSVTCDKTERSQFGKKLAKKFAKATHLISGESEV